MADHGSDSITPSTISQCLKLYAQVVERVYKQKVKPAKLPSALADDKWRYDELPKAVKARGSRQGLQKSELERLVQWKITHGQNRPFLPGMIRKNAEDAVLASTKEAFALLEELPPLDKLNDVPTSSDVVSKALNAACKLTGVGPATGTLVLSVFHDGVPFFEDELFEWCFPDYGKLKYTPKEYATLYKKVQEVMKRTGRKAVDVEHTAFVLKHRDVLDEAEKKELSHATETKQEPPQATDSKVSPVHELSTSKSTHKGSEESAVGKQKAPLPPKRASESTTTEDESRSARRSKRLRS